MRRSGGSPDMKRVYSGGTVLANQPRTSYKPNYNNPNINYGETGDSSVHQSI